jgi:hypothetical protein
MPARKATADKTFSLAAWVELNHLRAMNILPESFEQARIGLEEATPIYDLNGEILYRRMSVKRPRGAQAYVDIAAHPAFGEPFLAVSSGAPWNAEALQKEGRRAAKALGLEGIEKAELRFVAYSFPKLALQFLLKGEEALLLELYTWQPVPPSARSERYEPPGNFERWSFLQEMPEDERADRTDRFDRRVGRWREVFARVSDLSVIDSAVFLEFAKLKPVRLVATRELHYSTRNADHHACYEVRGQRTNVWCVGASVQMVLDFYRYEYSQVRLAQELGLGTLNNPNGLPYSRDGDVVTVLEAMTRNALDAGMNPSPTFSEFEAEIDANRPLISFVPGHSRTVAGYTRSFLSLLGQPAFRGLLVYDPWPPNAGVITRWENFNTTTYRRTFTAQVRKA